MRDFLALRIRFGGLLAVCGVLAATGTWIGFIPAWPFELFTHFRLQYTVALLPLAIGLIALKRRGFGALAALSLWTIVVRAAAGYFLSA